MTSRAQLDHQIKLEHRGKRGIVCCNPRVWVMGLWAADGYLRSFLAFSTVLHLISGKLLWAFVEWLRITVQTLKSVCGLEDPKPTCSKRKALEH